MQFQQLERYDLQWCLRLCPNEILELLKKHPKGLVVAGGYVRDTITREKPHDIDLFAATKELAKAYAEEYAGGNRCVTTDNAYTVLGKGRMVAQFIHRWAYPTPEALLGSFDFTVAAAAFWHSGTAWESLCHPKFYPDLAARRLVYTAPARIEEAGGSMLRVLKFNQRGYRVPLDSLGAVVARLVGGVDMAILQRWGTAEREAQMGKVLCGLLREVDPDIDPTHIAHLPALEAEPMEGAPENGLPAHSA